MISVKSVPELVDALGGLEGAATAFSTTNKVVWNWKFSGKLPAWARLEAGRVAQANGIILAAKLTEPTRRKRKAAKAA
jgi:hypothetical protein